MRKDKVLLKALTMQQNGSIKLYKMDILRQKRTLMIFLIILPILRL